MTDTKLKLILALVILLGPLASAVLISLFTKRHKDLSAGLSVGAVAISLICSIVLFVKFLMKWLTSAYSMLFLLKSIKI